MRHAYYVIMSGLIIQFIGFVWDLKIHSKNGVNEGLDEFFTVPAHDLIIGGFIITIIGFCIFSKILWQNKQS